MSTGVILKSPPASDDVAYLRPRSGSAAASSESMVPRSDVLASSRQDGVSSPIAFNEHRIPEQQVETREPPGLDALLDSHRARLEQELIDHRSRMESDEEESRKKGFDAGFEQGRTAAAKDTGELIATLEAVLADTRSAQTRALAQSNDVMASIIVEAVCKILGERLVTADAALAAIDSVIDQVRAPNIQSIRVSSRDYARIENLVAGEGALPREPRLERLKKLPLQADDAIAIGGCIVDLSDGEFDGRIETQLLTLAESLAAFVRAQ